MHNMLTTVWLRGIIYLLPVLSMAGLVFLWSVTNPSDIGPAGIFAVFVIMYLFWLGIIFILLRGVTYGIKKIYKRSASPRQFNFKKVYYIATIVAFIPVLILAMQSVGQLELRDVLLVILFAFLAVLYVMKRS